MVTYLFYDPKRGNQIVGQSTESTAMSFPYIETDEMYNVLQHVRIIENKGKKIAEVFVTDWENPQNIFKKK